MAKKALLFPGQGSQYVGMGKVLSTRFPIARETFAEVNEAMGFNLTKLMFEGSMGELTKTEFAQPAILGVSVAMYRAYRQETGISADYMAGHSLGEIAALTCSGAITLADAVRLVHRRSELMRDAAVSCSGAMAAVNELKAGEVEAVCSLVSSSGRSGTELVVVSNYNSEEQVVISGHKGALNEAAERLTDRGGIVIPLPVSAPFHSPLMAPAAVQFAEELRRIHFSPMHTQVVSSVTARPYAAAADIPDTLTKQLTAPVQWTGVMRFLQENAVSEAIEIGPQSVLKKLARGISGMKVLALDHGPDMEQVLMDAGGSRHSGLRTDSLQYPLEFIIQCLAIASSTRNRNGDAAAYAQGAIEPYRQVQKHLYQLEQSGGRAEREHLEQAYAMLKSVLLTKQVPEEEQTARLQRLLAQHGLSAEFFEKPQDAAMIR